MYAVDNVEAGVRDCNVERLMSLRFYLSLFCCWA
jgi:hypothetical protein